MNRANTPARTIWIVVVITPRHSVPDRVRTDLAQTTVAAG